MGGEVGHCEEVIQEECWKGEEALLGCPCLIEERWWSRRYGCFEQCGAWGNILIRQLRQFPSDDISDLVCFVYSSI